MQHNKNIILLILIFNTVVILITRTFKNIISVIKKYYKNITLYLRILYLPYYMVEYYIKNNICYHDPHTLPPHPLLACCSISSTGLINMMRKILHHYKPKPFLHRVFSVRTNILF